MVVLRQVHRVFDLMHTTAIWQTQKFDHKGKVCFKYFRIEDTEENNQGFDETEKYFRTTFCSSMYEEYYEKAIRGLNMFKFWRRNKMSFLVYQCWLDMSCVGLFQWLAHLVKKFFYWLEGFVNKEELESVLYSSFQHIKLFWINDMAQMRYDNCRSFI